MSAPRSAAIWSTRRDMTGCYVRCVEDDLIEIFVPVGNGIGHRVSMPRSEARMVARRINECLDATVKP
jgi:hypothetical protein